MNRNLNRSTTAVLASSAPGRMMADAAQPRIRRRALRVALTLVLLLLALVVLYILATNLLWRGVAQGEPAPDFTAQDLDGKLVRLSDLRGQPVMLTFWSPDCFACREELPALQAIADDPSADVVLLTVVSHLPAAEVRAFVQEQKLTFRVIVDEAGTIPSLYQVKGIPFTYFIGAGGRIERAVIGAGRPGELQNNLQGWLNTCKIDAPCAVE
jgi:peroxiredoxin